MNAGEYTGEDGHVYRVIGIAVQDTTLDVRTGRVNLGPDNGDIPVAKAALDALIESEAVKAVVKGARNFKRRCSGAGYTCNVCYAKPMCDALAKLEAQP